MYDYQQEIVNKYIEHYKNNNKAILTMPCGTGKTIIACYITKKYKKIIFISPLKQFAEQNMEKFKEYDPARKYLLVDSDGERNVNKIAKFIRENDKCMLSVTYASCDVITKFINSSFVVVDEFHNLSKNNVFDENDHINKVINLSGKILFMSATPRIYELENNDDLCNEDIESMFGKTVYKMDFKSAIENNYITDYKIYLPTKFGSEYRVLKTDIVSELNVNLNDELCKKCCYLFEAIKNFGKIKCIAYFRNCDEIGQFMDMFRKINEYYAYQIELSASHIVKITM